MVDMRNRLRLKKALVDPFGPPSTGFQARALASLGRSRSRRIVSRTVSMIAFAALLGVAVTAIIAGHVIRLPSESVGLSHQDADQLAQLRQRPLQFPALGPTGSCPSTALHEIHAFYRVGGDRETIEAFGSTGPIYGRGGPQIHADQGYYYVVEYLSDATYPGLALVRGQELSRPEPLMFAGPMAQGRLVRTGLIEGTRTKLFDELVLPRATGGPAVWRTWQVIQGIPGPGCYGIQLDGPSFHDTIVVEVISGGAAQLPAP